MSTPSKTLQKYAQPVLVTSTKADQVLPYPFKQWIKIYQGILPGQEYKQYNEYLLQWYRDKQQTTTNSKELLQLDYYTLLRQLQIFFSEEETENWFNNVDLENEKELLLAIPYFAQKLKQITSYYQQLRQNVKEARLKYNQVGTDTPILEQVQKNILSTFNKKGSNNITIPSNIWKNVPELSTIQQSLVIEIEELYDKQIYLDRSPSVPVSAYYNINNTGYESFLKTKNLSLTSTEWMYKLGTYSLTAIDAFDENEDSSYLEYVQTIAEKYLGQNKFTSLSLAQSSIKQDLYDITIETGNNFFLWPGKTYYHQAEILPRYTPVFLKDIDFSQIGTAGTTIENSDTIFVKSARGIEGAWLAIDGTIYDEVNMEATLNASSKTTFKYPYPGYGLSGENIGWTGPSFKTAPEFFYLENETKQAILNEYWSTSVEPTGALPVLINNSTLVQNKAYPNENYDFADKIRIWPQPPIATQTSYFGEIDEAWLYKFKQTNISIQANSVNTIYWPYEKINTNESFPTYFPEKTDDICLSVYVSSLNVPFVAAGSTFDQADKIYKINNYLDTVDTATECCWLSSNIRKHPSNELFYNKQPSFQGIFESGNYTKFVWDGPNNTDVRDVFKSLNHLPTCDFVTTKNTTYKDFNLCTCRRVLFTPLGHPGENFTDNNSLADFIVEDTYEFDNIDLENVPLSAFCWFQTNNVTGWGDGQWISRANNFGNRFYLKTGQTYVYYRAGSLFENPDDVVYPSLVIRHDFQNFKQNYGKDFIWIRSLRDPETGNWVNTDTPSTMELVPGNLLLYSRADTRLFTLTSTLTSIEYVRENRGSIWSNADYITINDGTSDGQQQSVILGFPIDVYNGYAEVITPDTPVPPPLQTTILSTAIINNVVYETIRYIAVSSVNVPSSLSATTLANIKAIDPTPNFDLYCIQYEPNNTVTLTFEVTGIKTQVAGTVFVTASSVNTTKSLSSIVLQRIIPANITPNTYKVCVVDNTVTFTFNTTANTDALLVPQPVPPPPQIPETSNILGIAQWEITNPLQQKTIYKNSGLNLIFSPTVAGIYTVAVTAITSSQIPPQIQYNLQSFLTTLTGDTFFYLNTGYYVFTNIPPITAINSTVYTEVSTNYSTPLPGFVLEVPLQGWDYNTNRFYPYSIFQNTGAKPFWAKGFVEKDLNTKFKSVESQGTVEQIVDEHNIVRQPEFSDIVLSPGQYLEYTRNYFADLKWVQPLTIERFVNNKSWRQILVNDSTDIYNLNVTPTLSVSDIVLQNFIDNKPVEIHYNAITPFTWSITAIPEDAITTYSGISSTLAIQAASPWNNLTNQHYPTVAITPSIEKLYSEKDVGGFSTPKNLGASVYLNHGYSVLTNLSSESLKGIFEDSNTTILSRGLTLTDQDTPYSTENNNIWLKELQISSPIAGTNNKQIFKKYQKFIPYQSKYDINPLDNIGLTTPNSRQTPWGGLNDIEWVDVLNKPVSPTGELNIEKWEIAQQLKQTSLQLDYWSTDIFNNQYGLYKNLKNSEIINKNNIPGQLWVRKNNQFVGPAVTVLSGVFDTYKNTSIFNELTGTGIIKFDVFYDTLMVQTTGAILFEKIVYNYNTNNIFSTIDDARTITLSTNYIAGETWFYPEQKELLISLCKLQNSKITPEIYELDIQTQILKKVFPVFQTDITTINNISTTVTQIQPPTLSYNSLTNQILYSVLAKNTSNKNVLFEFTLFKTPNITLDDITIYQPPTNVNYPPIINQALSATLTIALTSSYPQLNFVCTPINGFASFRSINLPSWVNLTTSGLFTGTPPNMSQIYNLEFVATNSVGPAYYNLIVNVIKI